VDQRLLLRVTAPAVAIGLVLFAACLASMRYINRLQESLADIVAENVTSLQAAQDLEIRVRQLRFHTMLYLMEPRPERLQFVETDQQRFAEALGAARGAAKSAEDKACVQRIDAAYRLYQKEQSSLRAAAAAPRAAADFPHVADSHPVRLVVEPCQELLRLNKERMEATAAESQRVSREAYLAMLLIGLAGPVGGLVMGYGVARGLRRSIYRLSVRVQDMAQRLDQKVASVSVAADGDLRGLDRQIQHIVDKVEEVTERVQQQQRELLRTEQLAAVGQLAAGVAHEVRNPLTGIKLLVEAALRPRGPRPLGPEDLHMIHREIARLEQTVQGFLDFARLPPPRRSTCDLREVLRRACDLVRTRAEQQQVQVVADVPGEPVHACVDGGQVVTVLVNLFLNALDAMPQGGCLEARLAAPAQEAIHLTVTDTGPGIPAALAERLFTPFTTTKPTGTGLGLSLSRRIVEEHDGAITACNRPDGGACFAITLPGQGQSAECRAQNAE
jgi:signal transduction histidine kinase